MARLASEPRNCLSFLYRTFTNTTRPLPPIETQLEGFLHAASLPASMYSVIEQPSHLERAPNISVQTDLESH